MHETPCKLGTTVIKGRLLLLHSVGWMTTRWLILAICISVSAPITVFAWLYPEHRDITLLALKMLEPEQRSVLEELWSEARRGHESSLCVQMADSAQGLKPNCI